MPPPLPGFGRWPCWPTASTCSARAVGWERSRWCSRYGITLLVKLTILGVVALTGFYNWRFVLPRLGTGEATASLRRSARVEVAVAVLVLLVTAVPVATPTSMDMVM